MSLRAPKFKRHRLRRRHSPRNKQQLPPTSNVRVQGRTWGRGQSFVVEWSAGCQMAKFDPFLSLDCAPAPSTPVQSKGSNLSSGNLALHYNTLPVCPNSYFAFVQRGRRLLLVSRVVAAASASFELRSPQRHMSRPRPFDIGFCFALKSVFSQY